MKLAVPDSSAGALETHPRTRSADAGDAAVADMRVHRDSAVGGPLHLQIAQIAIHLVGVGEDQWRLGREPTHGFKNGQGALDVVGWAGAVLCFLAAVRRGLSFRQRHGPTPMQLATMLWLFVLAAASLLSPWPLGSLLLQIAGYGTMAVADPAAARRGEVPVYFQRLRPAQMLLLTISLTVLALRLAL